MKTIDEVLRELEQIVIYSIENNDRAGYFAALYYRVTAKVRMGIAAGEFEDGARMERLDVIFAQRYLDAYYGWRKGEPVSRSWEVAFDSASRRSHLALQHLLLGINAHINLDLGIAATMAAEPSNLRSVYNDFKSINNVIASLTYGVINDLRLISPFLSVMGIVSNSRSMLIEFSISSARDGAWCFAEELIEKKEKQYEDFVLERDTQIAQLAQDLIRTKGLLRFTVWVIRLFERRQIGQNIELLHTHRKKQWHEVRET